MFKISKNIKNYIMQINEKTRICGSIAIRQSDLGSAMHNSAYEDLGVNFLYIPFTVSDCKDAVAGIRALGFRGSSVSMPYKQEVMKYLDKIDPIAEEIGAVNTIVNDDGLLTGFNSDWIGAMEALKEVIDLQDKKVVLLGAGGASRAIAYGLKQNNCKTIIYNRTAEKGKSLAQDFGLDFGGAIEDFKNIEDYDILINATSVGFYPSEDELIVNEKDLKENKVVMDIVIKPLETPLLKSANAKNCKIISGYRMLIYQALFQIEKYTGRQAKFEVLEKALLEKLKK